MSPPATRGILAINDDGIRCRAPRRRDWHTNRGNGSSGRHGQGHAGWVRPGNRAGRKRRKLRRRRRAWRGCPHWNRSAAGPVSARRSRRRPGAGRPAALKIRRSGRGAEILPPDVRILRAGNWYPLFQVGVAPFAAIGTGDNVIKPSLEYLFG